MESKYWCFTINNPQGAINPPEGCVYMIYQLEIGDNNTLHYQGYIEFNKKKRLTTAKKLIDKRAHLEVRRGTQQQAIDYCNKTDTRVMDTEPFIFGIPTPCEQGKRNDLLAVKEMIEKGVPEKTICDEHWKPWLNYHKAFKMYRTLITPKRDWKTEVTVMIGPPGCGKSKACLATGERDQQYWKQRSQWWDEYEGQPIVILDDFYGWLPWDVLLRICDRYPLLVETKGGQAQFNAKQLFITSNAMPNTWYKTVPNFKALTRRVDKWIIWTEGGLKVEADSYENCINLLN